MVNLHESIVKAKNEGKKLLTVLIDPDSVNGVDEIVDLVRKAQKFRVDYFFFGGSLITKREELDTLKLIKEICDIPVILFPSGPSQIRDDADAILFLSLLSGRNPEYLIGHQVTAAPILKDSKLEILATGYLLVSCGKPTTAEYMSGTPAIPYDKAGIAAATAMAGEMLGMKLIYLDGGSGAEKAIDPAMVLEVRKSIDLPLIVGGGIRNAKTAARIYAAGADMIVVGNGAEENPDLIESLSMTKTAAR